MRGLIMCAMIALLSGCATPSEKYERTITNYREDGSVWQTIHEITVKFANSTFFSIRVYGVDVGFEIDTKIPHIRFGIIKYESARVSKGQKYYSDFSFEDVSLLKGSGNGHQFFTIEDIK